MNRNDFLTSCEAAEIMMCSRTYVVNLIKEGYLPVYKVGNRYYIPKSAVHEYIEEHSIAASVHIKTEGSDCRK